MLAPVSVKRYRSAISSILKHLSSDDFSSNPVLSDIIKSLELEKPVVSKAVPHWDLSLVLDCLKESPFEPMSSCSLKCLTQKTLFLMAFASGRRCSEIHALSASSSSVNFSADKRLFISFVKNYDKEISPSTLSRLIVDTVRFAYDQKCSSTSNKICAHELRALSASFAWLNGVPLDAVLFGVLRIPSLNFI